MICPNCGRPQKEKYEIIDALAFVLFRRHLIDAVQTGRLDRQLSESSIKISWSADGKNRAYWYQLARAALGEIVGEVPMPIPERKDAAKP